MNTHNLFRFGNPTCAGSYRMAYAVDGARYLQRRAGGQWKTIPQAIPKHIRGAYAAAAHLGV